MINFQLSIDGNKVNGFSIEPKGGKFEVWWYGNGVVNHLNMYTCNTLEEAVKYCLDQ